MLTYEESTEVLQRSNVREARDRSRESDRERQRADSARARITEHAGLRIGNGVLNEVYDRPVAFRLCLRVQAKDVVTVLYACV